MKLPRADSLTLTLILGIVLCVASCVTSPPERAQAAVIAEPPSAAGLAAAQAYSEASNGGSFVVLHNGAIIAEAYAGGADAQTGFNLASGTKSFWGVAAAAAVQDGLLSLDEPVADTLTAWRDDPQKATVSLRQLLQLTAGQETQTPRERIRGAPLVSFAEAAAAPLVAAPGTTFSYGSTPFQTFGEVLRLKLEAAGEPSDPLDYLTRRIFEPLGIAPTGWRRTPDGLPTMPSGGVFTARDWATFGEFVRQGGVWQGTRLVDEAAFRSLFEGSEANPAYGVTWWLAGDGVGPGLGQSTSPLTGADLPADTVIAAGAGNQRLYVIPSRDLVVVRQAPITRRAFGRGRQDWSDAAFLSALLAK